MMDTASPEPNARSWEYTSLAEVFTLKISNEMGKTHVIRNSVANLWLMAGIPLLR